VIPANAMANNEAPLVTKDERIRGAYKNAICSRFVTGGSRRNKVSAEIIYWKWRRAHGFASCQ
jgi:hypothetical protein